jgi:uncharacterized protein (DUF2342 family)
VSDNPFSNMFSDLFNLLGQQGPNAWFDNATQLALSIARGSDGDPNPLPSERARLEELAPLVSRYVDVLFEVSADGQMVPATRSALTSAALAQWRPLIEPSLAIGSPSEETNPMLAQLAATIGPLFTGMQMGSIAGHFSERAWSLAALALPRLDDSRLLVVNNLVAFADAWSLERDDVYIFALAQEFVASLVLTQPGTGDALRALLLDGVKESAAVQRDILSRLQSMISPEEIGALMGNPESLLDEIELPEDTPATRAINAATAVLSAVFDAAASDITNALVGERPALAEAYRRHRRSDARGEDAAAALFGIANQGPHHDEAAIFVAELAEEHGLGVFSALLRVDGLPSAEELTAPSAWYQRVTTSPLA